MVCGLLGWLLDPRGDHDLGDGFLSTMLSAIDLADIDPDAVRIVVEGDAPGRGRFDIRLDADDTTAVLEVKAKTRGSREQLVQYADQVDVLARVGFGEWNFPDLEETEREQWPLVDFQRLAGMLEKALDDTSSPFEALLRSLVGYVRAEQQALDGLHDYFLEETRSHPPARPHTHRLADRGINALFWHWFVNRWRADDPSDSDWKIKSQKSGVWCSNWPSPVVVPGDAYLVIPDSEVQLPGPFSFWLHTEIWNKCSVFANEDAKVGSLMLKVRSKDRPANKHLELYKVLRACEDELRDRDIAIPRRRPSRTQNFTAVSRRLRVSDLRYSNLRSLLMPYLNGSTIQPDQED